MEGQHTQFIRLSESCLLGKEIKALGLVQILLEFRPNTMFHCNVADTSGQFPLDERDNFRDGDSFTFDGRELFRCCAEQRVYGPLPPAGEGGVVHGDFTGGVEDVPGLDLEGDGGVDGREEELEAVCLQ